MKQLFYGWLIALPLIIIIDMIWFYFTVQSFYKPNLSHIISSEFNYAVAFVFYFIYSFCIAFLVVIPSSTIGDSIIIVFFKGFALGIAAYCAYNLTNQATIKEWPTIVTIVDTIWGGTITAIVASITYKCLSLIKVV